MTDREAIVPDSKDWTWVISQPCRECGFDGSAVYHTEVAGISGPTQASGRGG